LGCSQPELAEFYAKVSVIEGIVTSEVNGVQIVFDAPKVGEILGIPAVGVFMDRVPEPKEVLVRVPKILSRKDGDPYPNRKLSGARHRVPNNFSSDFWLTNNPIITNLLFFAK